MFFADGIEELGVELMKHPEAEVLVVVVDVLQEASETVSLKGLWVISRVHIA